VRFSLVTWNVNSIRTRLDHVLTYLANHEPDVMCLQETKVEDTLFPRVPFMELGYTMTLYGGKGLAGVATLSKRKPQRWHRGFREGVSDKQCRLLFTHIDGISIYNMYVPNGTAVGSEAFVYKLEWLRRLRVDLDAHEKREHELLLCGDFNIAPDERDVWSVDAMLGHTHFTEIEHEELAHVLEFGLHDCYRKHHPERGGFTWFDYRMNAFERNEGLRIDHVYASRSLYERSAEVIHDYGPRSWSSPSDHIPVRAVFDLP